MPVKIKERDIQRILVTDGDSLLTMEKYSPENTFYVSSYMYFSLEEEQACCECCGMVYDSDEKECPECGGNNIDNVHCENMAELIYDYIEDELQVVIMLFNGDNYVFKL